MKVDVVVINYKTPNDLEAFCNSLFEQEDIASITIVNNDPTPLDMMVSERLAGQLEATIINNMKNVGYARAANAAAADLDAPVLSIFNADVVALPGSIKAMADFMEENPDVGIAGPRQVDHRGRITHGGVFGTDAKPVHRGWHNRDGGQFNAIKTNALTVSGAAYFVRRTCWDELTACSTYQQSCLRHVGEPALGAFLPTRHYYEETFCSYHARAHGWKNAYVGAVKMIHLWHRSSPAGAKGADRHIGPSRDLYRKACDDHGITRE